MVCNNISETYPVVVDIEDWVQRLRPLVELLTVRYLQVFGPFFVLLLQACHHRSRIRDGCCKSDGAQEINSSSSSFGPNLLSKLGHVAIIR